MVKLELTLDQALVLIELLNRYSDDKSLKQARESVIKLKEELEGNK